MSSVWSIRRSTVDKKLAGVCGGVARHWNVDPVLVRVGWVLLALSGGVGIVLYAAAWLLVPADGATSSTMDDLTKGATQGWPREAWVAIVAIACLITFGDLQLHHHDRLRPGGGARPDLVLRLLQDAGEEVGPAAVRADAVRSPDSRCRRPRRPRPSRSATRSAHPLHGGGRSLAAAGGRHAPQLRGGPVGPVLVGAARRRASRGGPRPPTDPAPAAAPAWQTYPATAGPSTVQDPVSPRWRRPPRTPTSWPLPTRSACTREVRAGQGRRRARAAGPRPTHCRPGACASCRCCVLGLVLLGLAVADALGAPITPVIYAAAALLVVGLTLVAATWLGRARGILPVGLLLLVAVLGLSVAMPASRFVHQVGYTSVAQLPAAAGDGGPRGAQGGPEPARRDLGRDVRGRPRHRRRRDRGPARTPTSCSTTRCATGWCWTTTRPWPAGRT